MTENKSGREDIKERLHEAIDGLRKDATRVEIWATALSTFAQPIPEYRPNPEFELGTPVKTGPLSENEPAKAPKKEPRKLPK